MEYRIKCRRESGPSKGEVYFIRKNDLIPQKKPGLYWCRFNGLTYRLVEEDESPTRQDKHIEAF